MDEKTLFMMLDTNIDEMIKKELKKKNKKGEKNMLQLLFGSNVFPAQSWSIKTGSIIEKTFREFIKKHETTFCVTYDTIPFDNNKSGKKDMVAGHQIDICFTKNGVTYFFESKTNPDLDTKKIKIEVESLNEIKEYCIDFYKKNNIDLKVETKFLILTNVKKHKEPLTTEMICYYNDFFAIFGFNITQEKWETKMKEYGDKMIKSVV